MRSSLRIFFIVLVIFDVAHSEKNWSEPPDDSLGVRLAFVSPSLFVEIKDNKSEGGALPVKYSPNSGSRTAVTLFYSHFSLTGSASNGVIEAEKINKGSSNLDDYQFRFYYRYGTWDFFYQYYKGYYIDNSAQIDSSYVDRSEKILRNDLVSKHTGIQYMYTPNYEDYSLGGTFDQNIRQINSGGSLFYSAYVGEHSIKADQPIIPATITTSYGNFSSFSKGYFKNIRIGMGYAHTLVFYNYYFGFLLGLSSGLQKQEFQMGQESFDRWISANGVNLKVGLGYNGKKYFSGLQYVIDNTAIPINEYTIGLNTAEVKVFFGSRFDDIKIPFIETLGKWLYQ